MESMENESMTDRDEPGIEVEQAEDGPVQERAQFRIPNFAADAEAIANYEAARGQYEQDELGAANEALRATYTKKRAAAQAEVEKAKQVLDDNRTAAETARRNYARSYKHRLRHNQLESPNFWEILFSFGGAYGKYRAATRATEKYFAAMTVYRQRQREEMEVEEWLARGVQRVRSELRKRLETPGGLDTFHARPEIAPLWARVEQIRAERKDFESRLGAGQVSPRELRDRTLSERSIAPLRAPFESAVIVDLAPFGNLWCWVFSNAEHQLFWLSYDPRLFGLMDWVFDTYVLVDALEAKFTRSPEGRRITPLDRYLKKYHSNENANMELRKRNVALRFQQDNAEQIRVEDPEEQKLIDVLASLAEGSPTMDPEHSE